MMSVSPILSSLPVKIISSEVTPVSKPMIIQKQPCEYYRKNSRDKLLEENL